MAPAEAEAAKLSLSDFGTERDLRLDTENDHIKNRRAPSADQIACQNQKTERAFFALCPATSSNLRRLDVRKIRQDASWSEGSEKRARCGVQRLPRFFALVFSGESSRSPPRLPHTTPRATAPAPPRGDVEPRASPRAGAMDLSGAPARLCVSNPPPVRSAPGRFAQISNARPHLAGSAWRGDAPRRPDADPLSPRPPPSLVPTGTSCSTSRATPCP